MSERRHANVVHLSEIEPRTMASPKKFGATMRSLGLATGAQKIGCSHYEVEPGRAAFPRHFHCANEESIYVLEGEATLEIGEARVPVRAGDYATFPIGTDNAHKLVNTGSGVLRYLCFSTMSTAEVVGYPDSKKVGAAGAASMSAALAGNYWVRLMAIEGTPVGYYAGEDDE